MSKNVSSNYVQISNYAGGKRMKGITIGIFSAYSDDGDDFDTLLDVLEKAYGIGQIEPWTEKVIRGFKMLFRK
jgi:hypothetical protein